MKSVWHVHIRLLFSLLILTGCVGQSEHSAGSVTKVQALELAKLEFVKHRKLEDYKITKFDYDTEGNEWVVSFELNGMNPIPGGKDLVCVHKLSGRAIFCEGE